MPGVQPEPWTSLPLRPHRSLHPPASPLLPPPDPPHVPWCPGAEGATPSKTAPARQKSCKPPLKEQQSWHCGLTCKRTTEQREVNPTQPQRLLAWLRRAPQGRAPSGSGGKRRTLVSWIRLANSLEETKRKGARGRSGVTWLPHPSNLPLAAGPMKMLWCISSGALFPLLVLNPGGETSWVWPRRRVPRAQSRRSEDAETKAHCPESSTWEIPSPVHPLNAGAPSSKLSAEDRTADPTPTGQDEGGGGGVDLQVADSQPQEMLTH